jgi:osmoprotectant transport system permease protein
MEVFTEVADWFSDPLQWSGTNGIPNRLWEHIQMSGLSVLAAMIPGLLWGLYIGHKRRFEFISVTVANLGRALPSFAILAFFFPIFLARGLGFSFWPAIVALAFLAVPPILINTYIGIREVDPDAVEAARGMGMSDGDILRNIELPLAAPLIVTGVRTSAVQVVATATLAALVAGGGLGRYIVDGFAIGAEFGRAQIFGGAILVAALAIITESAMALVGRVVAPRTGSDARRPIRAYREPGQVPRPAPGPGNVP